MSVDELFAAGGIVMWPLLLFSVVTLVLTIERSVFWFRINRRQRPLIKQILEVYREQPAEVFPLLRRNLRFPMMRIFLEALQMEGASQNQFRLALEGAAYAERPLLKRFNSVFQTIIAIAPLLGLLGTILGLIRSFASVRIGEMGADAGAVTGGISEALVSTAAGMIVAIFALAVFNIFRSFYRRQVDLLQESVSQLEILYEWHCQRLSNQESPHARI
ncbi:MAG: MotA/TolQ/ExbB proton channel family protein [Cyanobacteria bacterium J06642_11]